MHCKSDMVLKRSERKAQTGHCGVKCCSLDVVVGVVVVVVTTVIQVVVCVVGVAVNVLLTYMC